MLVGDSVDQRMMEILEAKSGLFDAYTRRCETAETRLGLEEASASR